MLGDVAEADQLLEEHSKAEGSYIVSRSPGDADYLLSVWYVVAGCWCLEKKTIVLLR